MWSRDAYQIAENTPKGRPGLMCRAMGAGATADDRGETGWKSTQDYTVLDKGNRYGVTLDGLLVHPWGN